MTGSRRFTLVLLTAISVLLSALSVFGLRVTNYDNAQSAGPAGGWLIIHGGGTLTNETKERFVALAGGHEATFVAIPTALSDAPIDLDKYRLEQMHRFDVKHVVVLHTKDRVRANSDGFVEPLRHASGVWIDGGRQYRLADAYLGTAVEREIKALLARGGVVCGSSAGATIQGSFLVRGAPSNDNTIIVSPGHVTGFGLLPNSAIDQHVNARGREGDLDPVIDAHPELLGVGLDQDAAIVVHGDSFFVVGGQVAIHDGKPHDGAHYFFLSSGQSYDLKARSVQPQDDLPLVFTVNSASRKTTRSGVTTVGQGVLQSRTGSGSQEINYECGVSLYSVGKNEYPARPDGAHQIKILAREVNTDRLLEYTCKF
jgi:cyanophycinase